MDALLVLLLLVILGVGLLNLIATDKIITKAGYSGEQYYVRVDEQ